MKIIVKSPTNSKEYFISKNDNSEWINISQHIEDLFDPRTADPINDEVDLLERCISFRYWDPLTFIKIFNRIKGGTDYYATLQN